MAASANECLLAGRSDEALLHTGMLHARLAKLAESVKHTEPPACLSATAAQFNFEHIGSDNGGAPDSLLYGHMVIEGVRCHVEAYAVEEDLEGVLTAVNPAYEESLEAVKSLSGDPSLRTVEIDGNSYVIVVYPQAN